MGTKLASSTYYLVVALIILPFLLFYIYRYRTAFVLSIPLSFIAGGAIGNLIDRIRLGQVVDFVDVDFFDINFLGYHLDRWWTFNVADAAISCAIAFLFLHMFIGKRQAKSSTQTSPPKLHQPSPD